MAAPNRPNPGDARIPCPLCGGLIHPIAGRCKHCKQDLSALRSTRPAAGAALPALVAPASGPAPAPAPVAAAPSAPMAMPMPTPVPAPPPSPYANGASNGHYAPPGLVGALANGHDAAHPILPPRPTGRMITAPQAAGWWKSWPMIVIVLAGIAIVIAVVLMVWPPGASAKTTQTVEPPPAPERMDTNPLPQTHGSITPPQKAPTQIPDDPTPPPSQSGGTQTQLAILDHACDRLMACGNDAAETFCDTAKTLAQALGVQPGPPSCQAGVRCIARIDRVSCTASAVDVQRLMNDPDCAEALTKC